MEIDSHLGYIIIIIIIDGWPESAWFRRSNDRILNLYGGIYFPHVYVQ